MNAKNTIVFDCETCPLPEAEIVGYMPAFSAPANFRDKEKIKASIEEQRVNWLLKAALSPVTGRIDAIGVMGLEWHDLFMVGKDYSETTAIKAFWNLFRAHDSFVFAGFNSRRFDLPFLVRRSWHLGVAMPIHLRVGRYWSDQFVDLMEVWQMGSREEFISLDKLARFMGLPGKNGSGADFHKMEPEIKKQYLTNDLKLTWDLALKML